ncbi:MAG: FHA domain-containing protein [Deltaproteobacteria bacterium]|nr:FHA domain-containing protein [Deltaproteobacteria bacterium]
MPNQIIATLRIKCPDEAEKSHVLHEGESVRIGRDANNDLVLSDPAASRVHATISASSAGVVIADNKSTNGTFLNGRQVTLRDVQSGDVIDIGSSKISVEIATSKVVESLSSSSVSRAMTAQLKPISVTVLVGTLYQTEERLPLSVPSPQLCEEWSAHAAKVVKEFGGAVDKQISNHIVALWLGGNSSEVAANAVKAARRLSELTTVLASQMSGCGIEAKLIVSSGHGLKGMVGGAQQKGNNFTILGDPINAAFLLEEGIEDITQKIIVCPSTAELLKGKFQSEELKGDSSKPDNLRAFIIGPSV